MTLAVFCDFDGTITLRDSNDALVDAFIGKEKREAYDRLFLEGTGCLWQILDTSLRACAVPLEEAIGFLHAHVPIDPTFSPFHAWCRDRGIPLEIVSAGLYEVVSSFMQREGLQMPISANRASILADCFGLSPADEACPTGVDKARILAAAKQHGITTVFIGDGFSDRLAVREADLVYAKSSLATFCRKHAIPFTPFESFDDIRADLEARLASV